MRVPTRVTIAFTAGSVESFAFARISLYAWRPSALPAARRRAGAATVRCRHALARRDRAAEERRSADGSDPHGHAHTADLTRRRRAAGCSKGSRCEAAPEGRTRGAVSLCPCGRGRQRSRWALFSILRGCSAAALVADRRLGPHQRDGTGGADLELDAHRRRRARDRSWGRPRGRSKREREAAHVSAIGCAPAPASRRSTVSPARKR